jgi:hypothetical protein
MKGKPMRTYVDVSCQCPYCNRKFRVTEEIYAGNKVEGFVLVDGKRKVALE